MTFLNPKALIWAALALPVVVLYLRRMRPRRLWVSTGFLWEQVLPGHFAGSSWRRFRHSVSLCLQLTILALVIVAMAEPRLARPSQVVLIIDTSASMKATDVWPSRFQGARRLAEELIIALGDRDQMAIVAAGDPLRVCCGLTDQQDVLRTALDTMPPAEGPTRVADAVALAGQMLAAGSNGTIVVLSDGCFDGSVELAGQGNVEWLAVGGDADNVALTRLEAARSPGDPNQCQVFAEVTSFAGRPLTAQLELAMDGKPIDAVPIELPAGGRWQRVFEITTAEAGKLTATLAPADVFADDDRTSTVVPPLEAQPGTSVTGGSDVSAAPCSAVSESDVRVPAGLRSRARRMVSGSAKPPLWLLPAAAALALLAAEWYWFQRRWVC